MFYAAFKPTSWLPFITIPRTPPAITLKAEAFHIPLAEEVLTFLAQRVRTNVRRLEGALMRVGSYQSLSGRACSRETVEQLLRDILREEAKKTVTIEQIQEKVAEHFDVGLADMTSKRPLLRFRVRWRCIWLGVTPKPRCSRLEKPLGDEITEQCCTLAKMSLCA